MLPLHASFPCFLYTLLFHASFTRFFSTPSFHAFFHFGGPRRILPSRYIRRAMRTTASYELFPDAPSERAMARARYLAREGRIAEAEKAYRDVLAGNPDLKVCWAECFELLRSNGRTEDALRLAEAARAQFGDSAFPLALMGAALVELERYREALRTLEEAVELDPDLALVWHELGYAAFRLGDRNRALLALDRAFALEPHTETLRLRGRILRDAGRYQAAEGTYEGAAQAADHHEQREAAGHGSRLPAGASRRHATPLLLGGRGRDRRPHGRRAAREPHQRRARARGSPAPGGPPGRPPPQPLTPGRPWPLPPRPTAPPAQR